MTFFIGFLALVSTQTLYLAVNAEEYLFENIQISGPIIIPENDVFTSDPSIRIYEYKQKVDELLINVTVTYLGDHTWSGGRDVLYNGELLSICDNQEAGSWAKLLGRIFKIILAPPKRRRGSSCPIEPMKIYVNEIYPPWPASINDTLDTGAYQFSYTAQTDKNTIILSSLNVTANIY